MESFSKRTLRLLVVLGLAAGCMRQSAVWLEPGSTLEHLRFGYGARRGSHEPLDDLQLVQVAACGVGPRERRVGERVLWLASGNVSDATALAGAVSYGEPPRGLVTRRGPERLAPGCYVFSISGNGISASTCFEISAQGGITQSETPVIECQVRDRAS